MKYRKDDNLDPKEVRVIIQNGTRIRSFRLLRGDPTVKAVSKDEFLRIQHRLNSSEKADPEEIVALVLSLDRDDPSIYRCGGEANFEPLPGKNNFWVTDLVHRDPAAPQLTTVADAWDFCYQIYPRKREDIIRQMRSNDRKMSQRARRFKKLVDSRVKRLLNSPQEKKQDDTPPEKED